MRTFRRPVLAVVAVAASAFGLFASATAAYAGTTTTKGYSIQMNAVATTCPAPGASHIGESCILWTISSSTTSPIGGPVTTSVSAIAYAVQVIDAFGTVDGLPLASGGVTSGTFSSKGKTTKAKFTVPMICSSPPCALGGATAFNLTLTLGTVSSFNSHSETDVNESTQCLATSTQTTTHLLMPKIAGTVKVGGKTRAVRRYAKDVSSAVHSETLVTKLVARPICL